MLDMSDFFDGDWEVPAMYGDVTKSSVDFVPSVSVIKSPVSIIIQPASNYELKKAGLDTSIEAVLVFSLNDFKMSNTITDIEHAHYSDKEYIIVSVASYDLYGFGKCIAERVKA